MTEDVFPVRDALGDRHGPGAARVSHSPHPTSTSPKSRMGGRPYLFCVYSRLDAQGTAKEAS